MGLGRIVVAWIFVAAWFEIATLATSYLVHRLAIPPDATVYVNVPVPILKRRLGEASLVTLIGSLWFDSLGSGAGWLLFLLFGALVSSSKWFSPAPDGAARRALVADIACDVARYMGAGALLAWRLS